MKRFILIITLFFILLGITLPYQVSVVQAEGIVSPYYTYTANAHGRLIKTSDAYLPGDRIFSIESLNFVSLEHLFIDDEGYIYITDSKIRTYVTQVDDNGDPIMNPVTGTPLIRTYVGKIIVLNSTYQLVAELIDQSIAFPKSTYVTEDAIYVVDVTSSKILVYDKSSLLNDYTVSLIRSIGTPDHPVFKDTYNDEGDKIASSYPFRPEHVVVDDLGNIYVQGVGSTNGLIMLDELGEFLAFFGGNPLRVPMIDQIRGLFLNEEQQEKMQDLSDEKIYYDVPNNLTIDEKGYIYTVTSSLETNPIKKFNASGYNFFNSSIIASLNMNSIWTGKYNNVFAINGDGQIFEYDTSGNLLFLFGGKDYAGNRVGLLTTPVSLAVNQEDHILVVDRSGEFIQVYKPTEFTQTIHRAFQAYYDEGDYEKSQQEWEYIMEYNSMFDYAHIGLGDSLMREKDYEAAYHEYRIANYYSGMSDAQWAIRQLWLNNHLDIVFYVILGLFLIRILYFYSNRKWQITNKVQSIVHHIRELNYMIDELLYIFTFLKHPLDGLYAIKREKRVHVRTATLIYVLLAIMYILHFSLTNIIFIQQDNLNVLYEVFVLAFILVLFVTSNYLVCAISDGEGTLKNVYNATAYSLTPILVLMPLIIGLSNIITFREFIYYQFTFTLMYGWSAFLMFFMIKDIHNYSVKQTFWIIFKSFFTMLVMGLFIYVINAMANQIIGFVTDIIQEVFFR